MRWSGNPLRAAHPRRWRLTGGRAPLVWRSELGHEADRLDALQRSWAWVERLMAVKVKLRDTPLLGDSLPAVLGRSDAAAGTQAGTAGRRRGEVRRSQQPPQPNWAAAPTASIETRQPSYSAQSNQEAVPGLGHGWGEGGAATIASPGAVEVPQQLAKWLDRSTLRRLAQEEIERKTARQFPAQPPVELRPEKPLSDVPDSSGHREWLADLARRAARALYPPGIDHSQPGAEPILARQWALSPARHQASNGAAQPAGFRSFGSGDSDGRFAPLDLLKRLANRALAMRPGAGENGRPEPAKPPVSSPEPGDHNPVVVGSAQTWPTDNAQPGPYRDGSPILDRTREDGQEQAVSETAGQTEPNSAMSEGREQAGSLHSLFASSTAGHTLSSTAAAMTRRRATGDQASATGADMNLLAAQIKRILDEEARRHGIDV